MKQNFDELVDRIVEKSGVKRAEVLEKIEAQQRGRSPYRGEPAGHKAH
jgi:hypothetical protein